MSEGFRVLTELVAERDAGGAWRTRRNVRVLRAEAKTDVERMLDLLPRRRARLRLGPLMAPELPR